MSIINGSTNNVIKNVTVGGGPRDVAVNPTTNMAYVANGDNNTVSIINGSTNNVVAGVTFNINPPNGGDIYCNQTKISDKDYVRYDVGSHIDCNVNAHSGFMFSSWSSNLDFNSSDTMTTPFTISRYGNSTANFVSITPISIPQEYLVTLVGVIISFLIPSIASWWNGRRQRGVMKGYIETIATIYRNYQQSHEPNRRNTYFQNLEDKKVKIEETYAKGKISDPHYQFLKDKISEYRQKVM